MRVTTRYKTNIVLRKMHSNQEMLDYRILARKVRIMVSVLGSDEVFLLGFGAD